MECVPALGMVFKLPSNPSGILRVTGGAACDPMAQGAGKGTAEPEPGSSWNDGEGAVTGNPERSILLSFLRMIHKV